MPSPLDTSAVKAILFDMNGTLRSREPHPETTQAALDRLRQLLLKPEAGDEFWEQLHRGQKAYSRWAQANLVQKNEAEIWAGWMLPDTPMDQLEPIAPELMLAWQDCKGRSIPKPGAAETLASLRQRGYRLGVISNTMSTLDVPRCLQAFGWMNYFEVVILSAELGIRKPSPEPFLEAARRLQLPPAECAYIGNRLSKDIPGCKKAGYACSFILESPLGSPGEELKMDVKADAVIQSLDESLRYFPQRAA